MVKKNLNSQGEVDDFQGFDIKLISLIDDSWKGEMWSQNYLIPRSRRSVTCTAVGVNKDLGENGVTGFWARIPVEWQKKLSVLVEDALLREKLGKEGRKGIFEKYTIQSCAPHLYF